jgi:hypothetical protein
MIDDGKLIGARSAAVSIWTEKWPTHSSGCFSALSRRFANVDVERGTAGFQADLCRDPPRPRGVAHMHTLESVSFLCAARPNWLVRLERSPMIVSRGFRLSFQMGRNTPSGWISSAPRMRPGLQRTHRWLHRNASRAIRPQREGTRRANRYRVPIYIGGSKTVSMTWITPLDARYPQYCAVFTITPPSSA